MWLALLRLTRFDLFRFDLFGGYSEILPVGSHKRLFFRKKLFSNFTMVKAAAAVNGTAVIPKALLRDISGSVLNCHTYI